MLTLPKGVSWGHLQTSVSYYTDINRSICSRIRFMSVWGLSLFHWLQCLFHYSVFSTIICLQIFSEAPQDSKSLSLILRQRFILPRWYPPSASSWIDLICIGNKKEIKIIIAYSFHISNLGSYIFTGLLSKFVINSIQIL